MNVPFLAALEAAGELVLPLEGVSMGPRWTVAEGIRVRAAARRPPQWGDVVVVERCGRIYAHRIIGVFGHRCWTKGDARWAWDRPSVAKQEVLGVVIALVPDDGIRVRNRWRAGLELMRALVALPVLELVALVWRLKRNSHIGRPHPPTV